MMNENYIRELIAKRLADELSADEERDLLDWLNASSENQEYYTELVNTWELASTPGSRYTPDADLLWERILSEIESESGQLGSKRVLWFKNPYFYRLAASVILVMGLGYILNRLFIPSVLEEVRRETADNMDVFYLPDSSIVWLDKNSELSYSTDFSQAERTVYLKGHAFFSVRKNPDKPFIVYAEGTKTRVLGTSFDLNAYNSDNEVVLKVVTGKVEFSANGQSVNVSAHEMAVSDFKSRQVHLQVPESKSIGEEPMVWIQDEEAYRNTDIYKLESNNAKKYIKNEHKLKVNVLNQTIIYGTLKSSAVLCSYKKFKFKVAYKNKKGKQFEEQYMLKDILLPGAELNYKIKLPDWFESTREVKVILEDIDSVKLD